MSLPRTEPEISTLLMPNLRLFHTEDLQRIHQAALEILERVGMLVNHSEAMQLLEAAEAKVDFQRHRVWFPPDLVEAKLRLVPKRVEYHGRTPEFDFICEPNGDIYAQVGGGSTGYIDLASGQYRRACLADLREFSILGDALPNTHVAAALFCEDTPEANTDLYCLQTLLESQRLPISTNAFSLGNLRKMIEMLLVVQGSRQELEKGPLMHLELSPISPLALMEDEASQLFLACEYNIPVLFPVMPNAGVTGPITLAGTLAQALAEWLGMVTLTQLARPGLPIPFFIDPVVADMHSMAVQFAAPEAGLLMAGLAQLGKELYGLAPQGNGLCTDGFSYPQTLFQKAQNALLLGLAGGKMMIGSGEVEGVVSCDPVQLVIDDEIMAITRRLLRPIAVNEDTLALDEIERVGPGGQFLDSDHTLRHHRSGELMRAKLFEHGSRNSWLADGSKTLVERAREKAGKILASHQVPPLADEVTDELHAILRKADEECDLV